MSYVSANRFLTQSEMEKNATYIYNYLAPKGWTKNAIAGMLGNMQTESSINPGIWQNLDAGNTSLGYGLVQWTPATKYLDWCEEHDLEPSAMESALERIIYELESGLQYYATDAYPLSFYEFKHSTLDPAYLGLAFLANYERPAEPNQPARGTQATAWYNFLGGGDYDPPGEDEPATPTKKKALSLLLMYVATGGGR